MSSSQNYISPKASPSCLRAIVTVLLALCGALFAEPIRLPQEPALSPDGKTIAFAWHGDLWRVPAGGGAAQRLTVHSAADSSPAFSPDGKQIAFISEREGSRQVYVMPSEGGEPRQLTFHTEGYDVREWMPDGKTLLVSMVRDNSWMREARSPRLALLDVRERHAEQLLFDDYVGEASVSPDGKRVLFTREGESWWRQGYHGSRAGQIWLFNRDDSTFKQLKRETTECRWPLWKPDGKGFFYLSNRDGILNLWEHDSASGKDEQRTFFKTDAVVYPALSRDGSTLVFRHLYDLYQWHPAQKEPQKIVIDCASDSNAPSTEKRVLDRATRVTFTQDGLQMAFLAGGDVWVMDTELREPHQVTSTTEEERDLTFAPDGKSLWFISDSGGQTDVWKAVPEKPAKFWWENSAFKLSQVTHDAAAEARIEFTRDSKHVAWVKDRGDVWVADADGQNAKRVIESWNIPDFQFSPDGTWIVYSLSDEWFNNDIWLLPVDGVRAPFNLSRHPDNDFAPTWSPDGKLIAWTGRRSGDEVDIHYVWLRAEDEEQTKRERQAAKAREKIKKAAASPAKGAGAASGPKPKGEDATTPDVPAPSVAPAAGKAAPTEEKPPAPAAEKPKPAPMRVDLDGIHDRIHRIAIPNTTEIGLVWSPDSKKLAFSATVEGKRGTYTVELPDEVKPKMLAMAAGFNAAWVKNDDQIVCLVEGQPTSITSKGVVSTHRFRALQSVNRPEKQRAVFDLCWRIMRDRYYDERLGNRDWNAVRAKYGDAAAAAPDMRAVSEIIHLMLGELNGSHLGFSLNGPATPANTWREETAHLGLRFDPTFDGPGWRVRDVLEKGPASHRASRIEAGEIILKVDGRDVSPKMDVSEVLNGPIERDIALHVRSVAGAERDVTLRPITYAAARKLLYDGWIKTNRRTVEQATGGMLGYLHIAAMSDESFELFEEELYEAGAGKDGLVIDVRENGGGSTADHLLTALMQPQHAITVPRGGKPGYPQDRIVYAVWQKPIVVLCNQNSFSNAEIFSHAIKTLKRGKLVGVPTAGGVISTGATSIMDVGTLRLPFRGWYVMSDGEDMELKGAQPDFVIWPQPGDQPKGVDAQLAKAIEVLRDDVQAWKKQPHPELKKASGRQP